MSRRNRKLPCAYCSSGTGTEDHIFAREFFRECDRDNLPTAPACEGCNRLKAELEAYATTVLPFAATNVIAEELLLLNAKRIAKNEKLSRTLRDGIQHVVVETTPYEFALRTTYPIDFERIVRLLEMIARGLVWHHWQERLPQGHGVRGIGVNSAALDAHLGLINRPQDYAEGSLAHGTFAYVGMRPNNSRTSMWRFKLFGSAEFNDDGQTCDEIVVTTSEQEFIWDLIAREQPASAAT